MRTERGSVLLHVMVTGAVLALIVATLLRMSLLRSQMAGRGANMLQEKRLDQGGLAGVIGAWSSVNMTCANNVPNYTCSPAAATVPGTCGCTCTPVAMNPPLPLITTAGTPDNCTLTIGGTTDLP